MNSNEIFLVILGIISAILIIPKMSQFSAILILATIVIGYSFTKNIIYSISVAFIIGNIIVSLNSHPTQLEGFESEVKKHITKVKKNKTAEEIDEDQNVDDAPTDEYFIDVKGSFLDNYKSLSNKEIKGLNKDTQNLISTQKQLIETLKNMGPALKDGKQILDTFKNYFGDEKDLGKLLKDMKEN